MSYSFICDFRLFCPNYLCCQLFHYFKTFNLVLSKFPLHPIGNVIFKIQAAFDSMSMHVDALEEVSNQSNKNHKGIMLLSKS